LFYTYADKPRIENLIQSNTDTSQKSNLQKQKNIDNLCQMVSYCENIMDCRRVLQLQYFGEKFNPKNCNGTCDNCQSEFVMEEKDVTEDTKNVIKLVQEAGNKQTLKMVAFMFRGQKSKNHNPNLKYFGSGKSLDRNDTERLLHHLVLNQYLAETHSVTQFGSISSTIRVGPKADSVLHGSQRVFFAFKTKQRAKRTTLDNTVQVSVSKSLSDELFQRLDRLRHQLGEEMNITPYLIFTPAQLQEMARKCPTSLDEIQSSVDGIAPKKVKQWGSRVVETIQAFLSEPGHDALREEAARLKEDKKGTLKSQSGSPYFSDPSTAPPPNNSSSSLPPPNPSKRKLPEAFHSNDAAPPPKKPTGIRVLPIPLQAKAVPNKKTYFQQFKYNPQ
jgi:bloom syndrome protein